MTAIDILAKQLWGMWAGFVALVPNMVIALVILLITWVAAKAAKDQAADRTDPPSK